MASRSRTEKNKDKIVQDRLQLLLSKLLQDEDNKYCVDCDSKGPRWASWNIGVFLCIRCAGIHRNLGVHISKVKSVNLDSWAPLQVSSMQCMGNSRGRAVYEARVPDDFRRPQSDQQLETFIRAKYEKKKYIALEWTSSKPPDLPQGWAEIIEAEKQKKDLRTVFLPSRVNTETHLSKPSSKPSVPEEQKSPSHSGKQVSTAKADQSKTTNEVDLIGLSISEEDPFADADAKKIPAASVTNQNNVDLLGIAVQSSRPTFSKALSSDSDFDDFISASVPCPGAEGNHVTPAAPSAALEWKNLSADLCQLEGSFDPGSDETSKDTSNKPMSKDSIMALFNQPGFAPPAGGGGYQFQQRAIHPTGVGMRGSNGFPINSLITVGGPSPMGPQQQPLMMNTAGQMGFGTSGNPFFASPNGGQSLPSTTGQQSRGFSRYDVM